MKLEKKDKAQDVLEVLKQNALVNKEIIDKANFSVLNRMILESTGDHDTFMVNNRYYNAYYHLKKSDVLEGDSKYAMDIFSKDISYAYKICSDFYYDQEYELNDVMSAFHDYLFERYEGCIDEKVLNSIISMHAYNIWHG